MESPLIGYVWWLCSRAPVWPDCIPVFACFWLRWVTGLEGRREAAATFVAHTQCGDLLAHLVGRKHPLVPPLASLPSETGVCLFSSMVHDPGFCKAFPSAGTEATRTNMGFRDAVHPREAYRVQLVLDLPKVPSALGSQWPDLWNSSSTMRERQRQKQSCKTV